MLLLLRYTLKSCIIGKDFHQMFKHAIVKRPCRGMVDGIAFYATSGKPDYTKALKQHDAYIAALEKTGVSVRVLEADEAYPDSCFVEDAAVLTDNCAVITNPGAPSRKGEIHAILPVIKEYYAEDKIHRILSRARLRGGTS
jgi:dimethylargininase